MGKFKKQVALSLTAALLCSVSQIPSAAYDTKPKNSFRGGSRGKGGKIKYARK